MKKVTDFMILTAKAIATSLGNTCETVIHDENRKIIYIENGYISGREVGNIMDKSVFEYLIDRAVNEDNMLIRLTKTKTGEILKSTTVFLFDDMGKYQAMLCFTMDVTKINEARILLDSIMNIEPFESNGEQKTGMSVVDYTRATIADIIKDVGKPSTLGQKEIKLVILKRLDEKGIFLIKDFIPQVCELLSISQATLYNYLREIRTSDTDSLS